MSRLEVHRWRVLASLVVILPSTRVLADEAPQTEKYRSPYTMKFRFSREELIGDLDGARGNPKLQSATPFDEWYSARVREHMGAWGPRARHYPPLEDLERRSLAWKRERVLAVALRFQGYEYQHHHIPDWNPPADWPWKKVKAGHNGRGVDCSNFTAFVYNLGFGIKPSSDVHEQARQREVPGPGREGRTRVERIKLPESYDELKKVLRTGDLLYIRNNEDAISHVVIWVGTPGQSPDNVPLIIDSHGSGVHDDKGVSIPCGIHIRPFREKSWYFHSASHAHRIWREE